MWMEAQVLSLRLLPHLFRQQNAKTKLQLEDMHMIGGCSLQLCIAILTRAASAVVPHESYTKPTNLFIRVCSHIKSVWASSFSSGAVVQSKRYYTV